MMCSLLGTPYMPNFNGCLLFLEEVKEPGMPVSIECSLSWNSPVCSVRFAVFLCDFTGCPGAVDRLIRRRLLRSSTGQRSTDLRRTWLS